MTFVNFLSNKNIYKKMTTLQERVDKYNQIKMNNRIPCIILLDKSIVKKIKPSNNIPLQENNKTEILKREIIKININQDKTIAELLIKIRNTIKLESSHALFIMCNDSLLRISDTIVDINKLYQDSEDKFLYFNIYAENTFG